MTKENRIVYILHAPVDGPAGQGVTSYLKRFPDVDLRTPSGKLPPFPKSIAEVNADYMANIYKPLVEPLILETIESLDKEGYGAISTASFGDMGLNNVGEHISTPIIGLGKANFLSAIEGWGSFCLIHPYTPDIIFYFEELMAAYGIQNHCVSIESFDEDLSAYIDVGVMPSLDQIVDLTLPCIRRGLQKGAQVFLIACGGQFWSTFAPYLSRRTLDEFNVPVLPPIDTMVSFIRKAIEKRKASR